VNLHLLLQLPLDNFHLLILILFRQEMKYGNLPLHLHLIYNQQFLLHLPLLNNLMNM
jgi:hypothetical protein